MLILF
ncbi:hypothetical protein LINPERPRIM_LOCUS1396 [Linum perenne]|jgi:fatty acid synthase subunit alpha